MLVVRPVSRTAWVHWYDYVKSLWMLVKQDNGGDGKGKGVHDQNSKSYYYYFRFKFFQRLLQGRPGTRKVYKEPWGLQNVSVNVNCIFI